MIVSLIGYRGSGKSTVAPILAERLNLMWVDADDEIERAAGCSIREIFANEGEAGFRTRERDVIVRLLAAGGQVLALGGGAILNPHTRRDLKAAGPVVWLRADAEELDRRINSDPSTAQRRPDLTAAGGREEIDSLLKIRNPLYKDAATLVVDAECRTDEIVRRILVGLDAAGESFQ